jgi:hypothetical protein
MTDFSDSEYEFSLVDTTIEGVIIAFLGSLLRLTQTEWRYYWIFYLSVIIMLALAALRIAATRVENPRWRLVRITVQFSSILIQIAALGIFAGAAIKVVQRFTWVNSPLWTFSAITILSVLFIVLVDWLFLGQYFAFWADIVHDEMGDDPLSQMMRQLTDTAKKVSENAIDSDPDHEQQNLLKLVVPLIIFLTLFAVLSLPIWYGSSDIFGSFVAPFIALLSLLVIQDISRYLYLSFGPAEFEELKTGIPVGLLILMSQILLLAEILGY